MLGAKDEKMSVAGIVVVVADAWALPLREDAVLVQANQPSVIGAQGVGRCPGAHRLAARDNPHYGSTRSTTACCASVGCRARRAG